MTREAGVSGITGLRLLPQGAAASLVNISSTGLLAESIARVAVNSPITLAVDGGFTPDTISGRVVRCEVAVMGADGRLRYHIGIEFDTPLDLDGPRAPAAAAAPVVRNRW
jgi:hypothetical protein